MRLPAIATLFAVLPLAGCATYDGAREGKPETVFRSDAQPGQAIVRQSTAHYYSALTPEGNRSYPGKYDHRYYLQNPDGTTRDLPFLDVRGDAPIARGVITQVYEIGGADAGKPTWVGLSEQFGAYSLRFSQDGGWSDNGMWRRDLTTRVFVKTFDQSRLLREAELDACNLSNPANPPILFDAANAALRYCDREGLQLYFPLTGEKKLERTALCCHDSSQMQSRRDRKDYYQRAGG